MKTYIYIAAFIIFFALNLLMVPDLISDRDNLNVCIGLSIIAVQMGAAINYFKKRAQALNKKEK